MGKDNPKSTLYRFTLAIILMGLIASSGCGGGSSDDYWPYSSETVIGPEGGVIEVTDPESAIYGFKMVIPEGALDGNAIISVSEVSYAPSLPAGLYSSSPIIEVTSDTPFLEEIEMSFPLQGSSASDEQTISAFCYDTAIDEWRIVLPTGMDDSTLTVSTQHLSSWQWGEVFPDEVEMSTLELLLDDTFGVDYIGRLEAAIDVELDPILTIDNAWNYCDNRVGLYDFLEELEVNAETDAEEYLRLVNNVCYIDAWGPDPMVSDVFYGLDELWDMNMEYLESVLVPSDPFDFMLDLVPYVGEVKGVIEEIQALAVLHQRQEQLKSEYHCIFKEADPLLWINVGVHYAAKGAQFAMELGELFAVCEQP